MNTNIVSELARCFPAEDLLIKPEDLMAYSCDGTPMVQQLPLAVVFCDFSRTSRNRAATGKRNRHCRGHGSRTTEDYGGPTGIGSHIDGCSEQLRGRDGQDDRCPKHCRRLDRYPLVWS